MRYTIILTLLLSACGAPEQRSDTLRTTLDTVHAVLGGAYQTVGELCDAREREVVEHATDKDLAQAALTNIRRECDQVLRPMLDVIEGTEKIGQVIDIPWVQEAL